jgi:hypothetical protein
MGREEPDDSHPIINEWRGTEVTPGPGEDWQSLSQSEVYFRLFLYHLKLGGGERIYVLT